jgi:hypothetical protein
MAPAKDRPAITDVCMPIMITLILQFFKEAALTTYLNGSDWKNTSPPVVSICYSFPDSESLSAPFDHQQSFCNYTVQQLKLRFNVYNICYTVLRLLKTKKIVQKSKIMMIHTHCTTTITITTSMAVSERERKNHHEKYIETLHHLLYYL